MATREEFDRRDLKEPDAFFETVGVVNRYVQDHRNKVIAAGVAFVGLIVAIGAGNEYLARTRANAAAAFARASANMDFESTGAAKVGFAGLVGRANSGPYGDLALLYKARLELADGDYDAAIADYDAFIGNAPTTYLRQQALVGKGKALAGSEKTGEALAAFLEAASIDGPFTVAALEDHARLALATGNDDAARQSIEKLMAVDVAGFDASVWAGKLEGLSGGGA